MPIFPAFQKDEALLTEIRNTAPAADCFACWRLGQGGFLIKWAGKHLLLVASSSLEELPLDPNQFDFLDVVVANAPTPDILKPIIMANPKTKLLIPEANRAVFAEQIGCDPAYPIGIDTGQSRNIQDFKFWAMPAALEADGLRRLGYVVQFGGFSICQCSEMGLTDEVSKWLQPLQLDLAILPFGGGQTVVQWVKTIGAQYVIPSQDFSSTSLKDFEKTMDNIGQAYKVLRNSEGVRFQF